MYKCVSDAVLNHCALEPDKYEKLEEMRLFGQPVQALHNDDVPTCIVRKKHTIIDHVHTC